MNRLDFEDIILLNKLICKKFPNEESFQILNADNIKSALSVYDSYYDSEEEIASALFRSLITAHGFLCANKRTAFCALVSTLAPTCLPEEVEKLAIDITSNSNMDVKKIASILYGNQDGEETSDDDTNTEAVDNNEAMVEELQNSIKQINQFKSDILTLQEKLSVSYAKESSQEEEIVKLRQTIQRLSEDAKKRDALKAQIRRLNEKLSESNTNNLELNRLVESSNQKLSDSKRDYRSLNESIKLREHEVSALKSNITSLNKQIASISKENADKIKDLTESLETLKKDSQIKADQYTKKLDNANKLVEKYKTIANTAVDKYIESEALKLGIKKEEIKNRLPESYSFKDIDKICEDLRNYRLSIDRLPFNVTESVKMKPKQSTHEPILPVNRAVDDEVDSALMEMAGLN